ncbi:MAG: tetratricopeptide repeat protein [Bacteroidota bacterium]
MKTLINTLLFVFFLSSTLSAEKDQRFQQGNESYSEGNYEEAIEMYEGVLESGLEGAALYYNLGNAYYKTGNLSQAILNYERALLHEPQNNDIRHNLELAYSQTSDEIKRVKAFFLIEWFRDLRNLNNSDGWAKWSIGSFVLVLVALGFYFFGRSVLLKKIAFSLSIVFLIFSGTTFSFSAGQKEKLTEQSHAIIFTPSVNIKSSPDQSGTNLFVLHEGTKVELLNKIGEWWNVKLEDGSEGWIHESDIEII